MTWSNKTSFKIRGHAGDLCLQFNGAVPTLWLFLTELCRSRTKLAAMFLIIPINKWSQPHRSRRHLMLSLSPCRRKKISVDVSVHLKVQGCCCLGPVRVDNEGPSNSPSASLFWYLLPVWAWRDITIRNVTDNRQTRAQNSSRGSALLTYMSSTNHMLVFIFF